MYLQLLTKIWGCVTWDCPYPPISIKDLPPPPQVVFGDSRINSVRITTPAATKALTHGINPLLSYQLFIILSSSSPTGIAYQQDKGIIEINLCHIYLQRPLTPIYKALQS